MSDKDELERQRFEAWFSKEFPDVCRSIERGNDVGLICKSTAWYAWLDRSKQEEA